MLILLNLLDRFIKSDAFYRGAMLGTIVFSVILLLKYIPGLAEFANNVIKWIPLGDKGFGYMTTAAAGAIIAYLIALLLPEQSNKTKLNSV